MGLKLLLLGWWTPKYIIKRELQNINNKTTSALETLITNNNKISIMEDKQQFSSIQEQRAAMAQTQTKLVQTLVKELGEEAAVKQGREILFSVGQQLGRETQTKLGVGDNLKDLIRAAKILYRILGIEFQINWLDNSNAMATINRCALSEHYSELTCKVLSATDEGVINGLQPNVSMRFEKYLTSGCGNCKAKIRFNSKEDTQ